MTKHKHTPGPWECIGSMDEDGECRIRQTSSVKRGDGFYSERTICEEVRSCADARLITAAPELLAALEALTAHWDDLKSGDSLNVDAARAAIAKATA